MRGFPVVNFDTNENMTDGQLSTLDDYASRLFQLLRLAYADGVVITVELIPDAPLAMKNYHMRANVRAAR